MAKVILAKPIAQEYLSKIQASSNAIVAYDLATAMTESLEVIAYAKECKNAMAYFKAVEHRAKLSGLLIDRVQVATVDIKAALEEARTRTLEVFPSLRLPNYVSAVLETQPNKTEQGGVPGGVGAESGVALSGAGPFPSTVSAVGEAAAPESGNP